MQLTVFVEPTPAGFRATAAAPVALTADGPTADAAVAAVQARYAAWLAAGGQVRMVSLDGAGQPPFRRGSAAAVLAAVARTAPPSDEFVAAIEEYRRATNTVPDDE